MIASVTLSYLDTTRIK